LLGDVLSKGLQLDDVKVSAGVEQQHHNRPLFPKDLTGQIGHQATVSTHLDKERQERQLELQHTDNVLVHERHACMVYQRLLPVGVAFVFIIPMLEKL